MGYLNLFSIIMRIKTSMGDFRKDNKKDEKPATQTHPQMQHVFVKNIKSLLREGKETSNIEETINWQTYMMTHLSC